LEVENTYLATFQALGGLGLLLGALGLAVVLLRSVLGAAQRTGAAARAWLSPVGAGLVGVGGRIAISWRWD